MTPDPVLVAALVREIMPQGLGVAAANPARLPEVIDPVEADAVKDAVPKRRVEFHAGREAARSAMMALDLPLAPIAMGNDRAPVWPEGVTGSIAHSGTACAAIVAISSDWAGLGIDLEEATALDPLLISEVCIKAERQWLGQQPQSERGLMAKLIFCAKEAAYKAQYPVSGRMFGFEGLEIVIDREKSKFSARFCAAQGPFAAGDILDGGYAHAAGLLVTGVAIRHSDHGESSN